ncbi:MAG: MFS transporter [Anaerolineales bacterium]
MSTGRRQAITQKPAINSRDTTLLFATRITRLFAYGLLSVVLSLYLAAIGFSEAQIGLLFTLSLAGDAGITLWITTIADRVGRRRMLTLGAVLMTFAGMTFLLTRDPVLLIAAAIIGVISPSGNEIGPFLSIEQAGLAELIPSSRRTIVFAWYNLLGLFATAVGALTGGWLATGLQSAGWSQPDSFRVVLAGYALAGFVLALCFANTSGAIEAQSRTVAHPRSLGLHKSRGVIFRLSSLFALDAFAGGFIVQSLLAYWFYVRYGLDVAVIGSIFFGANLLAGLSSLLAAPLSKKFGLINTMVFTHIPSNVLLILVPLMPSLSLAVLVLLLRFSISQMDVPTRQSYVVAVVSADERSAAAGVASIARSVGAAISPALAGLLMSMPTLLNAPIFLSGGLKIVYDLLLYHEFRSVQPLE